MKYIFSILILSLTFPLHAATAKRIQEEDVKFSYSSQDGEFNLQCTHYFDQPELHDFTVWCGKGTPYLRTFRVHFLIREHRNNENDTSALETLYWIIDRDQEPSRKFSSTSSWIKFKGTQNLDTLRFSQGVENDYASLTIEYRPN